MNAWHQLEKGRGWNELEHWDWHIYPMMYKIDNEWEPTLQCREPYSMLCGDLNGRENQKRGDTCICIADSLCYRAEINTTL